MILPRPILLDANALIYLDKIGIVRKVISLLSENGADPFTTNLVKQEMKVPSWKVLEGCGMKWHEVPGVRCALQGTCMYGITNSVWRMHRLLLWHQR